MPIPTTFQKLLKKKKIFTIPLHKYHFQNHITHSKKFLSYYMKRK